MRRAAFGALTLLVLAGAVRAEGAKAPLADAFPFQIGGAFTLTDGTGAPRTERDPEGRIQLLFFGYANCESICDVALPTIAEAADLLAEGGVPVRPVMITIDPTHDTVATIERPLKALHPDFVGLTGTEADLAAVRALYNVERTVVFEDPSGAPVYAHGSFIYVLDGAGAVQTLLPPILGPERIAEIVRTYAS